MFEREDINIFTDSNVTSENLEAKLSREDELYQKEFQTSLKGVRMAAREER